MNVDAFIRSIKYKKEIPEEYIDEIDWKTIEKKYIDAVISNFMFKIDKMTRKKSHNDFLYNKVVNVNV